MKNKIVFKKIRLFTITIFFVILGCSSFRVMAQPVVKWVYMADAEPINWVENGIAKGIEVEIVDYVMGRLGIKVKHEFYPWKRAQKRIEKGDADCMITTPTPARFKYAVFGKENILPNYWNLFIKKGDTRMVDKIAGLKKLEDLKPFVLLDFIGNGWTNAFLKKRDGFNIYEVARLEQIPLMIASGRAEIVINSSSWINWWAEKKGVQDQIQEFDINWPWTRFHFVFMLSRKSTWVEKGLIRALDEEGKKMKKAGIWHNLLKKFKNPHGNGKPFISHLDEKY